jgi:hypothetical protein
VVVRRAGGRGRRCWGLGPRARLGGAVSALFLVSAAGERRGGGGLRGADARVRGEGVEADGKGEPMELSYFDSF